MRRGNQIFSTLSDFYRTWCRKVVDCERRWVDDRAYRKYAVLLLDANQMLLYLSNQDNRSRPIVKEERVSNSGGAVLSRPDNEDEQDRERLAQTHLEQVSANKEFRPIVSFLNSMRYLHIVPQLIRDPHRYQVRERDFYGSDFLEQLVRTPERRREKRLAKITNALRIAVPQLKELKVVRDPTRGTPHLEGLWKHWRPNAGWQREDQFSDGTLRLLGLLWALLDGEGPLLLEEPELSLHSGVVQHIPKMFAHIAGRRGRQVIVSTHSAEILSDRSIALDEVFLLRPGPEGTDVTCAKDEEEIRILLEDKNITLGDVVIPKTTPQDSDQLGMFDQQ